MNRVELYDRIKGDGKENGKERLAALFRLSAGNTLDEIAERLGVFLTGQRKLHGLVLVQLEQKEKPVLKGMGVWENGAAGCGKRLACAVSADPEAYLKKPGEADFIREDGGSLPVRRFPVGFDKTVCGMLLLLPETEEWTEEDNGLLEIACGEAGLLLAIQNGMETESRQRAVFYSVLDGMKASVYVSDPVTDRILFMNQPMKDSFGLAHPEGQLCWQALQKGMKQRCPFCPVGELEKRPEGTVIQWEELNPVTGRVYRNYDSLIPWLDGSIVHFQQSVDVTELKSANTDELTQLMTRRPGKEAMHDTLEQAFREGTTVTVCMYDINQLKEVNDQYGHAEGDRLISSVSTAVKAILHDGEYAFRLSGDEFIVIFREGQRRVRERIEGVKKTLHNAPVNYRISFCYGLAEVEPPRRLTVEEALFLADERMYEQKRRFHILINEQRRLEQGMMAGTKVFDYNKELLYDALVQSTDDYIYVCNMKTGVFRYTKAMVEEFGLPQEVIENAAAVWGSKVHKDDKAAFLESNQEITDGRTAVHCVEYRAKNRKGEWVWVRCRGHLEFDADGEPELFAGFITNLGKKNKIDHLTGLYNKLEFEENIRRLAEEEEGQEFGIILLGIDGLKHINDLYNRSFGDEVIRITSQKLRTLLPADSSLYRLDGDEFGVLVRGSDAKSNRYEMDKIYRTILHSFESQLEYGGKKFYISLSAGCLVYPKDADNFLDIMKYAGYSLEYSKNHGKKRCTFFSQELLSHRARTLEMVEELREAAENDFKDFRLCYQPFVHAANGKTAGAEALARWECERFGRVPPVEFIPLLEQTGLIVPFGKWAIRTALRTVKGWLGQMPEFVLDVNISYRQVQDPDFVPFFKRVFKEEDFPPHNLVVELTESYFAQEKQKVQSVFQKLRRMGVHIAMDDFGTGYSTLGILKEAPSDIVKIDKTFVRGIQNSSFDATFIRFIVELCHDVGIQVCLEGVETEEEYRLVRSMDLDMLQGFWFAHPLPEQEFTEHYLS